MIQGGSTSVGLFAIQLARIVSYRVIATCSPHNFDLVKSYGAHHVFDYHDPGSVVKEIKEVTFDGVVGGLECIGGESNIKLAMETFGPKGGLLTILRTVSKGIEKVRSNVKVERLPMYTASGYVSALIWQR